MKEFIVKNTKTITEWWLVKSEDETDAVIVYDMIGEKILTKSENEKTIVEENRLSIKDGWDVLK